MGALKFAGLWRASFRCPSTEAYAPRLLKSCWGKTLGAGIGCSRRYVSYWSRHIEVAAILFVSTAKTQNQILVCSFIVHLIRLIRVKILETTGASMLLYRLLVG